MFQQNKPNLNNNDDKKRISDIMMNMIEDC